jgi:hypothetical protein
MGRACSKHGREYGDLKEIDYCEDLDIYVESDNIIDLK